MEKLVSNKEIEEKALELVKAIKEEKDYKEYIELRKKIKSNKEIMEAIDIVKSLQKSYVKSAYLDNNIKQELDNELNKLESIPLYKEYLIKEKKINNILINIREGLNIIFEDILNNKITICTVRLSNV